MTDINNTSIRNLTSKEQDALDVVKGQSPSYLELIIKALNENGIIIDNCVPSFHSSIAMNHWNPECEAYLRKDDAKERKINYTGGMLFVGWTPKLNNYCLYNSEIYSLAEEAVEYMDSVIS